MDNQDTLFFRNGSSIAIGYDPTPCPQATEERCIEFSPYEDAVRGHRATTLVYDEFTNVDWLDRFNSYQPGYIIRADDVRNRFNNDDIKTRFNQWWEETGQYEFFIDGDKIVLSKNEAPDFGEISPCQELNDFVGALTKGK